jgi:hypothetical protein
MVTVRYEEMETLKTIPINAELKEWIIQKIDVT